MESIKSINYEEKLNILRMVYPGLKEIQTKYGTLYSSKTDDTILIVDIDGNILLESRANDCNLYGKYLISISNDNVASVLNLFNNKRECIKLDRYGSIHIEEISGILKIEQSGTIRLFDFDLKLMWKMHSVSKFGYSSEDSIGYWYYYASHDTRYKYRKLRINKHTNSVDIYDCIDICDNYVLLGTDYTETQWYNRKESIGIDRLPNISYKIALNGQILSENSYTDILKREELKNSEYFYCYKNVDNHTYIGVLDGRGKEVIHPIYDTISYFNNDNFIVDDGNTRQIINVKSGNKSELVNKTLSFVHSTLPLYITVENNEYIVYDTFGRKFKVESLAKYFKCEYCLQDTDKIRVDLDYYNTGNVRYKYITKNLEPILDTRVINYLSTLDWVSM